MLLKLWKNIFQIFLRQKLGENIIECGILPEMFSQNGSEEKIWAKFSDIILAHALSYLGIATVVLGARGNSADVFGTAKTYTIVGDAKTFRNLLSKEEAIKLLIKSEKIEAKIKTIQKAIKISVEL